MPFNLYIAKARLLLLYGEFVDVCLAFHTCASGMSAFPFMFDIRHLVTICFMNRTLSALPAWAAVYRPYVYGSTTATYVTVFSYSYKQPLSREALWARSLLG
ncbi:uncharacterized protein C8Q71DRAFT_428389 [Rhodofomes roseus]|uniref:Secreted protein n=1 Tax=Rhodofomes roseus TaxID=34475 RepID=A0ABQ8KRA9_9APHY|nr:uncharacterized protein C8Q71DRAFT_428389 [Rhodofomes roseus]KAH9840884.1 hypothetical protein C8Q71DRAFT_428389 [Rhodofomes roseus]